MWKNKKPLESRVRDSESLWNTRVGETEDDTSF